MKMVLAFVLVACWSSPTVAFAPMTPIGFHLRSAHHAGSIMLRTPPVVTSGTVTLQLADKDQEGETTKEITTSTSFATIFQKEFREAMDTLWKEPDTLIKMFFPNKTCAVAAMCSYLALVVFLLLFSARLDQIVAGDVGYYMLDTFQRPNQRNWMACAFLAFYLWFKQSVGQYFNLFVANVKEKWDNEFDKEHRALQNSSELKLSPPASGIYEAKCDGRIVKFVQLTFHDDGSISVQGEGFYAVDAAWTESKVRWTEQLIWSSTIVRGDFLPNKSIQCLGPQRTYTIHEEKV